MSQIGTVKIQTQNSGIVELPVYEPGDIGNEVYNLVWIQTASGPGVIPFFDPANASLPYLRIQTQNKGILAAHKDASLALINDDFEGSAGDSLGGNYLISQGIRKTRNTDTQSFTFQKDGNSNLEFSHDGSGSNHHLGK